MAANNQNKYDKDFKKSLVSLYHNGKTQAPLEEENLILKNDCHLHATLKQRLDAVHKLRFQHDIKTLCHVPGVNRSTYYKHFSSRTAPRVSENQHIKSLIPHIYADYDKRLGAYKVQFVLRRDYGIHISVGRVYRLMNSMEFSKMSTDKPKGRRRHNDSGKCVNHLKQQFSQDVPNLVWTSDFTYIRAG